MKIKVTYRIGNFRFEAICDTIAEAYEHIKALFEDQELPSIKKNKELSNCMEILLKVKSGITKGYVNKALKFSIEAVSNENPQELSYSVGFFQLLP